LAKTLGHKSALHIYNLLLNHTNKVTKRVHVEKAVFYSDYILDNDQWKKDGFIQLMQTGNDLGEKMANAFLKAFSLGYKKVLIIGSDCFDLTENIITDAFTLMDENDLVLGPAKDGGYYLLGMKTLYPSLFKNKAWSTENVLCDTLIDLSNLNLSFTLLPTLSDIDEEKDLLQYPNLI
jgi:rSAM/selenodomain-associated transferase 1